MKLIALLTDAITKLGVKTHTNIYYCLTVDKNGTWWIWRDSQRSEGWPLAGIRNVAVTETEVTVSLSRPKRTLIIRPDKWEMKGGHQ